LKTKVVAIVIFCAFQTSLKGWIQTPIIVTNIEIFKKFLSPKNTNTGICVCYLLPEGKPIFPKNTVNIHDFSPARERGRNGGRWSDSGSGDRRQPAVVDDIGVDSDGRDTKQRERECDAVIRERRQMM
jgi:hypothetical protein